METEQIWWEQTSNPEHFINDIARTLLEEKSIVLPDCNSIPWFSDFINKIKRRFSESSHEKMCIEINGEISDIGEYLLDNYCNDQGNKFRPRPNFGHVNFIAQIKETETTFHNTFFLVLLDNNSLNEWIEFISKYNQLRNKESKAVFLLLLETEDYDAKKISNRKGIEIYSFKDSINEYDRMVFAMLASYSLKCSSLLKTYLTELACNVAGDNIELCSECLQKHEDFLKDPVNVIKNIIENETDSNGNRFVFSKTDDEIEQAVWTAQIRTFYPLLEEYRRDFIKKYYNEIKEHLPTTTVFNETIDTPEEVELGSLYYLKSDNYYHKSNKCLKIRKEDSYELKIFRNARHDLSHLHKLEFQTIQELLGTSFVKNRSKI